MKTKFSPYRWHIDCSGTYKVGDPMPEGYIDRQEWAEVHVKAGLKQKKCCQCLLWKWPHELSKRIIRTVAWAKSRGEPMEKVVLKSQICLECSKTKP